MAVIPGPNGELLYPGGRVAYHGLPFSVLAQATRAASKRRLAPIQPGWAVRKASDWRLKCSGRSTLQTWPQPSMISSRL